MSDKFGRQSTVVLSPVKTTQITDTQGITYGGSTYYHPYKPTPVLPVGSPANDINSWPGDSLKLLVNGQIPVGADPITNYPGVYNGDATSDSYNPLGWYSYKVVVKQSEQEYYNVYLPGIMGFYPNAPTTPPDPNGTIAFITLLNDNINKVPRDLTEVGPNQKQYRSSVELYGRVTPDVTSTNPNPVNGNQPYYPTTATVSAGVITSISPPTSNIVSTIALQNDFVTVATPPLYGSIYQTLSNPSMARLTQSGNLIGSLEPASDTTPVNVTLGVYETAPVESLLDIFWETSTSGLVSDFNDAVDSGPQVKGFSNFDFIQTESTQGGSPATNPATDFFPLLPLGLGSVAMTNNEVTIVSVADLNGNDVTSDWSLIAGTPNGNINTHRLVVVNPKYYTRAEETRRFLFVFNVKDLSQAGSTAAPFPVIVGLGNEDPVINGQPLPIINLPPDRIPSAVITTYTAVNGSINPPSPYTTVIDLSWKIQNQIPAPVSGLVPELIINSTSGTLTEPSGTAEGNYSFDVVVTDSGGATDTVQTSVIFGKEQINAGWGKRNNVPFSEGMQSAGMYWSNDYSNPSLIDVVQGNLPDGMRNTLNGRAVFSGLSLSNTGLSNTPRDQEVANSNCEYSDEQGAQHVVFINTNYRPSSHLPLTNNHALSSGTAYLKIDYTLKSFPLSDTNNEVFDNLSGPQQQGGVAWPSFLQYRASSNDAWVQAVDVEGENITLGGIQRNSYYLSPNTGATMVETGVINNNFETSIPVISRCQPSSAFSTSNTVDFNEVSATFQKDGGPRLESVSSKVFAIGKDQGGYGNSDKYGEYRLIVRFPTPSYVEGGPGDSQADVIPRVASCVSSNSQLYASQKFINANIKVNLTFGDFYYPNGSTETAFRYFRSATAKSSSDLASSDTPSVEVYAREWSLKYVTVFYKDPNLQEIDNTMTNGFYCYNASSDNTYSTENGNQNSFSNGNEGTLQQGTYNPTGDSHLRRWTANFTNSKKVAGTALPNVVVLPFY